MQDKKFNQPIIVGAQGRLADPKGIQGLSGIKMTDKIEEMSKARRPGKRASSAERWELAAMKAAGVLKPQDHPDFDEDGHVSPLILVLILFLSLIHGSKPRSDCKFSSDSN